MSKTLINHLSAQTRATLAKCRALAMAGNLKMAIDQLDDSRERIRSILSTGTSDSQVEVERLGLSLLKAELLHLDYKDKEAFEVFRTEVLTRMEYLEGDSLFVINQNRSAIELSLLTPGSGKNLSRSYDERNVAGVRFWDAEEIVYAYEYASEGKHYESLPGFFGELRSTYESGSWFAYRQAARRMAIEWLQLEVADLCVYQAMAAQDEKLIEAIGLQLKLWRYADRIRVATEMLLRSANLNNHAQTACVFFRVVADTIPDDQFDRVFDWLSIRARSMPENSKQLNLSITVWRAILELTIRQTPKQARQTVEMATNHPMWDGANLLRKELLNAVKASVSHLSEDEILALVEKALPAATTNREQIDYPHALNLLCHISDRSEKGRSIIGDRLYGTKEHVDFDLQQLAPYFGKTIDGDDANHMAMEVAKDIRLQVQRYKDGDKVNRPMVILASFTGHTADEKVIVHVYVFSAFDALLQYRKLLSAGSITELVAAATAMIFDTENIPANKVGLLNRIIRLADCLSPEIAEQLFENLLPLAKGEQLYLKDALRGFGDPQNPLNAFKIDMQSAEDVQTAALFTLAKIEEHHSGIYGQRLRPILEDAMADANPKVRGMAFAGVKRINVLGESLLTNLLLGTRDPDPNVATHAFNALAVNDSLSFSDEQWVSLVHSLALAASSSVSTVRRDAAFVIVKRESQWKGSPVEQKMKELKAIYGTDVCWSVRATISQSE